MALSKHTAAGTQGKGDRSSWGSRGKDGRWGEQEMSSCNLGPLFFCLATISAGSRGCLFANNPTLLLQTQAAVKQQSSRLETI